jgi:O-antigen/teichoic acid export membrane protein
VPRGPTDEARTYGRTASFLTAALALAGVLAYLFSAVASHTLTERGYGQLVVLWSVSFLLISILFRPVEQLLARTLADMQERDHSMGRAVRVAAIIQTGLAGLFAALAIGFRPQIEEKVFDGEALYFWLLVASVLAFSASYFVRGFFAGTKRMGVYAALVIVEGAVRLGLALLVALGITGGPPLMAIAIAVAPVASLVVVPFALTRIRGDDGLRGPRANPEAAGFTLAEGSGFAAAVLLIMLGEQVLLYSPVLFVRAAEGAAAAGFIFNLFVLGRAPVVLFQAVAASLLPHLSRLRARDDETSDEAFALSIRLTISVIAAFGVVVILGVLAVGPQVMQIAFGDNFTYGRAAMAIVAIGMVFYLAAGTLNQAVLAQGQARRAAVCWVACAVGFVIWNLLPILDAFERAELGFAGSAVALCLGLALLYRNPKPSPTDRILPGSGHELEAQLAAIDEAAR